MRVEARKRRECLRRAVLINGGQRDQDRILSGARREAQQLLGCPQTRRQISTQIGVQQIEPRLFGWYEPRSVSFSPTHQAVHLIPLTIDVMGVRKDDNG